MQEAAQAVQQPGHDDLELPPFLKRAQEHGTAEIGDAETAGGQDGPADDFQEDVKPPHEAAKEKAREEERELERQASGGHTAEEPLGSNGKPLVIGDIAHVTFGAGKGASEKTGTLLDLVGPDARVRLNGSKDPLGEAFPHARVRTEPVNMGKPVKTRAEKKHAAHFAAHMTEYREARAKGGGVAPLPQGRPSDGFAHAHAAAADETAPLPKRVLRSHQLGGSNGGTSEATIYRHLGNIRAKKAAVETATGKLREAWKKAKDDGVSQKALRKIMDELQLSPAELIDDINELNAYRAAVGLPSTGPIENPADEVREAPERREAYAYEEGHLAGMRGAEEGSNPYPDVTDPCHGKWLEGYRIAQNKLNLRHIKQLDS